ncbi:MAG: M12 family metallo-peptidase [Chitinophagaceae bacterium]
MKFRILFLIVMSSLFSIKNYADSFFTFATNQYVNAEGEQTIFPNHYQLAQLDVASFTQFQVLIAHDDASAQTFIDLPAPDGSFMHFRIFEESMMEPALAQKYPQIKTYTAVHIENSWITAKIDFTVFGFHAMVFDGENTFYIDPYKNMDTKWYMVYYKKDFKKALTQRMQCDFDESSIVSDLSQNILVLEDNILPSTYSAEKINGSVKKTYRLALACTIEYSQAVGGTTPTKASVLSAMTTTMNRVNGVFEREFSMHANLVANNDTLIFLSGTDPYTNGSGSAMLGQNQTTCTSRIGSANYDYGHVFSTGGGGIASLGSVCSNSSKAQGVTGSSNPTGDPFDIDYVAHEMGHQFGGSHTFNSVTGSCSGNRSNSSAYEIGSGTTIMAYAGICGSDDIQPHSDDYYHIRSLEQMTGNNVSTCATTVASNNINPTLSAIGQTYTIPYRTNFELTTSATDPEGDPMTFCWEEWDRGGSGNAWDATTTIAPIFRSFKPIASNTRIFPALKYVLLNQESYLGELLPDNARELKFKCTVRDIRNGYGTFFTATDTLRLNVVNTGSNLYRVTSQNTNGITWNAYGTETVTWDVAGTNSTPINALNVDIFLTVDSGKNWILLKGNTPNDGSEIVGVPNLLNSSACRVKVKASDNVFFDLNDKYFSIKSAAAAIPNISSNQVNIYPNPANDVLTIQGKEYSLFEHQYAIIDLTGKTLVSGLSQNDREIKISLEGLSAGVYFLKVWNQEGAEYQQKFIKK